MVSLSNRYNLRFDGFECKDFIDRNTLVPDAKKLIRKITQRTTSNGTSVSVAEEILEGQANEFVRAYCPHDLCNGHDVFDILGFAMTKCFASLPANQYNPDTIFGYLLMGYSNNEYLETKFYNKLTMYLFLFSYFFAFGCPQFEFSLPFLTLIEGQNVWQDATGNGLDLMLWNGCVIDQFFPSAQRIPPSGLSASSYWSHCCCQSVGGFAPSTILLQIPLQNPTSPFFPFRVN